MDRIKKSALMVLAAIGMTVLFAGCLSTTDETGFGGYDTDTLGLGGGNNFFTLSGAGGSLKYFPAASTGNPVGYEGEQDTDTSVYPYYYAPREDASGTDGYGEGYAALNAHAVTVSKDTDAPRIDAE